MIEVPRLFRRFLGLFRPQPALVSTPASPPVAPATDAPLPDGMVPDEVVNDEKARIDDLRTVAKWQLAALGAVATAAFAGVAVNKMPNAANPAGGGWAALWVAGLGAAFALSSIVVMITLVGWVLAPQFRPLNERPRSGGRRMWYDDAMFYLPDVGIHTLQEFLDRQQDVYRQCNCLTNRPSLTVAEAARLAQLKDRLDTYFVPVNRRLHWRNRREIVARRARIALLTLSVLGSLSGVGVALYLGAVAYHTPEDTAVHTLNLPAYGLWRPLSTEKPRLSRELFVSDLGENCTLASQVKATAAAGVPVMVLQETPADHTYQVLVTASGCTPRLYTVPQDEVAASTPFALPSP